MIYKTIKFIFAYSQTLFTVTRFQATFDVTITGVDCTVLQPVYVSRATERGGVGKGSKLPQGLEVCGASISIEFHLKIEFIKRKKILPKNSKSF